MLQTAAGFLFRLVPSSRRIVWRFWYQDLARRFRDEDWVFMNYGFSPAGAAPYPLHLDATDEPDRYSIQLYDHVLGDADLRDANVLEVGCGRGGGSSFIRRYRRPRTVTGVDLSPANIAFCRQRHHLPGLRFLPGDAEALPFADDTFDAVVNIESSHCYGSMARFLAEVRRVLRPSGSFFFADLRRVEGVGVLREHFRAAGLSARREETITRNVLGAMDLDSQRKLALFKERLPWPWNRIFRVFGGIPGTAVYESLRAGRREYLCGVFGKAAAPSG